MPIINLDPTIISSLITVIGMAYTTYISYRIAKINNDYDFKKNVELSTYKTGESNYFSFKESCMAFLASADMISRMTPINTSYDEYLANFRKVALECSSDSLSLMQAFNSVVDKSKYSNEDYKLMRKYLEEITLSLRADLQAMRERNKASILK